MDWKITKTKTKTNAIACTLVCLLTMVARSQKADGVRMPGGSFTIGTDESRIDSLMARFGSKRRELFASELPAHRAQVAPFSIDRVEVTNAAFKAFVDAHPEWSRARLPADRQNGEYLKTWDGGSFPAGEADLPVTFITWHAATAYCDSAGNACLQRSSGSLPQGEAELRSFRGVTIYRARKPRTGRVRASANRPGSAAFLPRTGSTIWLAMCGSSSPIPGRIPIAKMRNRRRAGA